MYKFEHSYDKHYDFMKAHNDKYPLVAISEFLISNDFDFVEVHCGGGINEVSHCGDKSYYTSYTEFSDFRDNFERDMDLAKSKERIESGGLVCSLNYGYIAADLQRDSLFVSIIRDKPKVRLIWKNISEDDFVFIEATNKKLESILESDFTIHKKIVMKDNWKNLE